MNTQEQIKEIITKEIKATEEKVRKELAQIDKIDNILTCTYINYLLQKIDTLQDIIQFTTMFNSKNYITEIKNNIRILDDAIAIDNNGIYDSLTSTYDKMKYSQYLSTNLARKAINERLLGKLNAFIKENNNGNIQSN